MPELLKYVEDDDLFRFALPDTKPIISYLAVQPMLFPVWDRIARGLENPAEHDFFLERSRIYREYFELLAEQAAGRANLVSFEGYEVLMGKSHPLKPMMSLVGNLLWKKQPPFALIIQGGPIGVSISMRGNGEVDLAKLAQKYGGNGHHDSAAFVLPWGADIPWTYIENGDETPRD